MRRRHGIINGTGLTQDPGKDIFAFLFIINMLFSAMLITSVNSRNIQADSPPANATTTSGAQLRIKAGQLGRIVKRKNKIWLAYGRDEYLLSRDLKRLKRDQRFAAVKDLQGRSQRILYLTGSSAQQLNLAQYFDIFRPLRRGGVKIIFVEESQ